MYIYGGIQKLNYRFIKDGKGVTIFFNPLLRHVNLDLTLIPTRFMQIVAVLVGICEMSMGVGLLFTETQVFSTVSVMILHVIILLCVGPTGGNFCHGIWAWNAMCIVVTPLLFMNPNPLQSPLSDIFFSLTNYHVMSWISLVLWGFLPVLNLYNGGWSDELSFKLHSLNFPQLTMCIINKNFGKIPENFIEFVDKYDGAIDIDFIARKYTHASCSSCRGGKLWAQYLSDLLEEPILFYWNSSPNFFDGRRKYHKFVFIPARMRKEMEARIMG